MNGEGRKSTPARNCLRRERRGNGALCAWPSPVVTGILNYVPVVRVPFWYLLGGGHRGVGDVPCAYRSRTYSTIACVCATRETAVAGLPWKNICITTCSLNN